MLIKLELINFKKHESLSIDFVSGLNVFRAANEAGKSSVFHAIAYALWGARALPDSLEETVTWGKPASSLKVRLTFSVADVVYNIYRAKSGAELTSPGLVVSGNAEVTAHVERLTGASAAVGLATLMASQDSLKDGLDGSAISLIEKLSDMGLIDTLVTSVQEALPCGNTKLLEAQLADLAALTEPVADFSALEAEKSAAEAALLTANTVVEAEQRRFATLEFDAQIAGRRLEAERARQASVRRAEVRLQQAQREVQWPVDEYSGPSIPFMQGKQQEQTESNARRRAHLLWKALPESMPKTLQALLVKSANLDAAASLLRGKEIELTRQRTLALAAIISEESCKLCGKLLTDVPEVVNINKLADVRLKECEVEADKLSEQLAKFAVDVKAHSAEMASLKSWLASMEKLSGFVEVDGSTSKWVGGVFSEEENTTDCSKLIKVRQEQLQSIARANAVAEAALKTVDAMRKELSELQDPLADEEDEQVFAALADGKVKLLTMQRHQREYESRAVHAVSALAKEQAVFQQKLHNYRQAVEQKASMQSTLDTYRTNNALIKKLREARPVVARELWALVLHGVSHVFSQIRGVPSTVTRSDNKFLIDGKPATVYSGSTKSALGLAIRVVLQKTFLPNVNFILLDEAAAGADQVRETAMLSALISVNFPQTVLVTHSELADTYATNLIVL